MRIVLDTNVLVAALRSSLGASFRLLSLVPSGKFEIAVSLPLYMEYRDVLLRAANRPPGVTDDEINDLIDTILLYAETRDIAFLWRPSLPDPRDEMVLEVAVAFRAKYIVTFNSRDFRGVELFGIECVTPKELLKELGEI